MIAQVDNPLIEDFLASVGIVNRQAQNLFVEDMKSRWANQQYKQEPSDYWEDWLRDLFPHLFTNSFADHHLDFWEHIESIQRWVKPSAFFAIWARGGAKTTSAEAAVVRLGAKEARMFCLYVRSVQDKANESVQNIGAMLEMSQVEKYYPLLGSRKMGKYGQARGWRIDTLRCANGFSVVALGLDAAVRGIKIEEFRPDLIILDDIDHKKDSLAAVEKKIDTITSDILPAGSNDVAVIGIQNLIHPNSIFSQIAEGTADFLHDRIVSGPHPAVIDLTYESKPEGGYQVIGGTPTWDGQNLEVCEAQINEWGPSVFLRESQHEVEAPPGGIWNHIEFRHCALSDVPDIVTGCVWCDPAVTDTDQSDAQGIQADGIDEKGIIYRFKSYEQRSSPQKVLKRAILWAIQLGFGWVGVETDQGGDTWKSVYNEACRELQEDSDYPHIGTSTKMPKFTQAKAGAGHGSKVHRNSLMLTDYEGGKVVHVMGMHNVLERALKRFPLTKPLDLADASYYGWDFLRNKRWRKGTAKARSV